MQGSPDARELLIAYSDASKALADALRNSPTLQQVAPSVADSWTHDYRAEIRQLEDAEQAAREAWWKLLDTVESAATASPPLPPSYAPPIRPRSR